jgi:Xaa-Pro aminopeptidase
MTNNRIKKLLSIINKKNIDIAFITCDENVYYFSGFDGGESTVILTQKEKYLFTDFRYIEQAEKQAVGYTVIEYSKDNKYKRILEVIKKQKNNNIGIEKGNLTVRRFEKIQTNFDGFAYFDISADIDKIRSIKSDQEIEVIKLAAKINDEAFLQLIKQIKIGISEMDIYTELTYLFNKQKCTHAFKPVIASGENSALPHAPITNRKLEDGDLLTIDFGAKLNNYCSDCTRTIGIGGLDNLQKKVYYTVWKAQQLAIDAIKAGDRAKDVDAVAREYISKSGFDGCFGHGLGHGLGLFVHEGVSLSPNSEDILEKNMVFSVEPGVYLKNKFGVRIEDIVTITDNGLEIFNSLYKDLIII